MIFKGRHDLTNDFYVGTDISANVATLIDFVIFNWRDDDIRRLLQRMWAMYKTQREVGPAVIGTIIS